MPHADHRACIVDGIRDRARPMSRIAGKRAARLAHVKFSPVNRFSPDPLLAAYPDAADQRGHPVIRRLLERRESGSRPLHRSDGRRIGLVLEGGGMRGVVSVGMTAAMEQLGLADVFDEVHGASAGAFSGGFFIAGQATYLAGIYPHGFGDPRFVSVRRRIAGRPIFDLEYVVNEVWRDQRPLHTERILESPIDLHVTATNIESAEIEDLTDFTSDREIRDAMLASSRLPWIAGGPVDFRGKRYFDATIAEAIPLHVAERTCTDLLVLQTRPFGVAHSGLSGGLSSITDRYLTKFNPQLVELHHTRSTRYDALISEIAGRAEDRSATPAICVIRPPQGSPMVSQVENSRSRMEAAGAQGFRTAWTAFEGSAPELVSAPHANV
jgi:predicted patatin/cPLA2 family phospholipase